MIMTADKIKELREAKGLTQTQIANSLGITRSSVNAWEMGISVPSTQYIVKLAMLFDVSTDYLLGMPDTAAVSVSGLSERQVNSIVEVISCFREKNK